METTEQQNIDNAIAKEKQTCLKDELEFLRDFDLGMPKETRQHLEIIERIKQIEQKLVNSQENTKTSNNAIPIERWSPKNWASDKVTISPDTNIHTEMKKCIMSKKNKCQSDYNKFHECDGINIPNNCPYKIKEKIK